MGKQSDPGMGGSLLYHMAMVTKMESETQVLLDEFKVKLPNVTSNLTRIYSEFYSDAKELTREVMQLNYDANVIAKTKRLSSEEKIELFTKLRQGQKQVEVQLADNDPKAAQALEKLFDQWAQQVVLMRFIQEYETIKGLLVLTELVRAFGYEKVEAVMKRVEDEFGQKTVNITGLFFGRDLVFPF